MTLPLLSVTVHVTTVVPTGNEAGALLVMDKTPQLSPVVGEPKGTVEKQDPGSVLALMSDGQVMVGGTLSITVTVCVHVEELP